MKIIYKNIEVETEENTTILDLFKETIEEKQNIIACMVNNEVKPLNYILKEIIRQTKFFYFLIKMVKNIFIIC